jgi:hypothetical protein
MKTQSSAFPSDAATSCRTPQDRRSFMKRLLAAGATANLAGLALGDSAHAESSRGREPRMEAPDTCGDANQRALRAYQIRQQAALAEYQLPLPAHPDNGDEDLYPDKIGSFTKGLPHNSLGEVDLHAYQLYVRALASGEPGDFERIPLGTSNPATRYPLVNPQAGLAFDLEGADSHSFYLPSAPTIGSDEENGEILENYWMALTRDVPFGEYDTNPLTRQAAADLSRMSDFRGPKEGGQVTTGTLFRGPLPGCLTGPYLSQFLWLPVPFGADYVEQQMLTAVPGLDFMTTYSEWLNIQNGALPQASQQLDTTRRYMRNGRDLGQWVHKDVLHQAYFLAMLTLSQPATSDPHSSGLGAPFDAGNPYTHSLTQTGFGTFGAPHIATLLPEVSTRALHAVWFQKWFVHTRLRPEAYAGLIQNQLVNPALQYSFATPELLQSPVFDILNAKNGSFLLPMAFPEGSPLHPSYGAGHATVAGACVTILKAWFDESFVIPNPVQVSSDGLSLQPYSGPPLTLGGELNKLAANIGMGRNMAGVHWRSDAVESFKLGEALAISILRDQRPTYNENFNGFSLTRFDGTTVTV